jgi:hypothetical protein
MCNLEKGLREQSRLMREQAEWWRENFTCEPHSTEWARMTGLIAGCEFCARTLDQFCDELFDVGA